MASVQTLPSVAPSGSSTQLSQSSSPGVKCSGSPQMSLASGSSFLR